ncbi:unnamed protein product [Allacma fusca]|uniref:CRAL-TRIO domain-containing protein n=1 Tax=Allacma fusca TaxID=39272 RepID=A0A8J2JIM9_9HEXA|nr:unnamed protein product [Allacma fusca]
MNGFDKDGCPVAVIPYGKWDVRKAIADGKKDIYLRYFDQMCERALDILKNINKNRPAEDPLSQLFVIWDLDGFSLRQITAKGSNKLHFDIQSNGYPIFLAI